MFGFNLTFQTVFKHPTRRNKCKRVPPVLNLYSVASKVVLDKEKSFIAEFSTGVINLKRRLILEQ